MCQEGLRPSSNLFSDFSSYLVNTKPASGGTYYTVAFLEVTQGTPLEDWIASTVNARGMEATDGIGLGVPGEKQKQLAESYWETVPKELSFSGISLHL